MFIIWIVKKSIFSAEEASKKILKKAERAYYGKRMEYYNYFGNINYDKTMDSIAKGLDKEKKYYWHLYEECSRKQNRYHKKILSL